MITREDIWRVLGDYDTRSLMIGTLGSHSALDISDGAKDEGFRTVVVCQKGRELPYTIYRRAVDETISWTSSPR